VEKFYTKILGTLVFDENGSRPLTSIKNAVVDPSTGKLCAFEVSHGKNKIIASIDVLKWDRFIKVHNIDSIIDADDVLLVDRVLKENIKIYKNKVVTKNGDYLGRVFDFTLDSNDFVLKNIYVAKDFWGMIKYDKRIINKKNIIEILKDKIIVKEDACFVRDLSHDRVPMEKLAKV
jgi:uncharacterized protein YrrD